jgi:TM2 domain-containing membrane protein YozV
MPETPLPKNIVESDGMKIDLKNRYLASVLAFLFPGAGHFYQGRNGKAGLFCSCILILFVTGLILSGGTCVYASWEKFDYRWHYVLQAGIGLPAAPAALNHWLDAVNNNGESLPAVSDWMKRPATDTVLSSWHRKTSAGFDLGTLFTMVAGLLNILVVFDAYGGPMPPPGHEPRKKKKSSADAPA